MFIDAAKNEEIIKGTENEGGKGMKSRAETASVSTKKERSGTMSAECLYKWFGRLIKWATICVVVISLITAAANVATIFVPCLRTSSSAESAFMGTGLAIIGIAIAVWACLNISNVISRFELNKLDDDVAELQQGMEEVHPLMEELRPFVEKNRSIAFQMFLQELERSSADPIARYFAKRFRKSFEKELPYADLTIIELLHSQAGMQHKSEYRYDAVLVALADSSILAIENMDDQMPSESKLVSEYLGYSKACFLFLRGYCAESRIEGAKNFYDAANALTALLAQNVSDSSFKECITYLNNAIGESYSKITHYFSESLSDQAERARFDYWLQEPGMSTIDEISKKAIEYLEKAVGNSTASSTYYRNLGCAYQRQDWIKGADDTFANRDEVISNFKKAVEYTFGPTQVREADGQNAYYTLLAYCRRLIRYILGRYINESTWNGAHEVEFWENAKEYIHEMYQYASIAVQAYPRDLRAQKLYGLACLYALKAYKAVAQLPVGTNEASLKRKIVRVIYLLELLKQDDSFTKELKADSYSLLRGDDA